jgi:predicted 3-demethylubiquinone-9 3-methyltransferase (glyoxalase superfamily)
MRKITPFLWFDDQAEEAMNFYVSIFKNSKVLSVTPGPNEIAQSVTFELDGQEFMALNAGPQFKFNEAISFFVALNAGPQFKFNEAISFFVDCESQKEVDELWEKLTTDGGEESMCGWLKDKYGLSWQIVPTILGKLLGDPDPAKSQRVMQAMLQMKKIDSEGLRQAYEQAPLESS